METIWIGAGVIFVVLVLVVSGIVELWRADACQAMRQSRHKQELEEIKRQIFTMTEVLEQMRNQMQRKD